MGLTDRLLALAVPHVLVVTVPGGTAARLAVERELRRRGWVEATSPADADLLATCGPVGGAWVERVERVWAQLPAPRARADVPDAALAAERLEHAWRTATDRQAVAADVRARAAAPDPEASEDGEPHDGDEGDAQHGEHGSSSADAAAMGHDHSAMRGMGHGDMHGMDGSSGDAPDMQAMDHSSMQGMDHSSGDAPDMQAMDHGAMQGMDHSSGDAPDMQAMDHGAMQGMDHSSGDAPDMQAMDHGAMQGMDHGAMQGMDHGAMQGMDHSGMQGMDHSGMQGMDHSGMQGMDHSGMQGMDHSGMQGMDHSGMQGMDHSGMQGMDHSGMQGMDHSGMQHGGMGHDHMGHGGMDMSGMSMPGGLPMADRGDDRDGLKLDQLHVPLGPFLPAWPTGLIVRCVLQGDVLQSAELEQVPVEGSSYWATDAPSLAHPSAAAAADALQRLLLVAGWRAAAAGIRRLRDDLLEEADRPAPGAVRWLARVRRSRTLRWSLDGLGVLGDEVPSDLRGDATARLRRMVDAVQAGLDGKDVPAEEFLDLRAAGSVAGLDVLAGLLEGQDVSGARLIVASLDPDLELVGSRRQAHAHA